METGVKVKVLFFAKARELVNLEEQEIVLMGKKITAKELKEEIFKSFPVLLPIANNVILAVNHQYVESEDLEIEIKNGHEIAIIPPLSGG